MLLHFMLQWESCYKYDHITLTCALNPPVNVTSTRNYVLMSYLELRLYIAQDLLFRDVAIHSTVSENC